MPLAGYQAWTRRPVWLWCCAKAAMHLITTHRLQSGSKPHVLVQRECTVICEALSMSVGVQHTSSKSTNAFHAGRAMATLMILSHCKLAATGAHACCVVQETGSSPLASSTPATSRFAYDVLAAEDEAAKAPNTKRGKDGHLTLSQGNDFFSNPMGSSTSTSGASRSQRAARCGPALQGLPSGMLCVLRCVCTGQELRSA